MNLLSRSRAISTFTVALLQIGLLVASVQAGDWPTFRGDIRRSGVGDEAIDIASLGEAWVLRGETPPQTAWAGPAKWDAYAGIRGLRAMRDYD